MGGRWKWLLWGSLVALAALALAAGAQAAVFTSPGTGQSYTMPTLDTAAGGTVTAIATGCHYHFTDTIIISAGDTLTIGSGCWIEVQDNRNLTIAGQLIIQGSTANPVFFDSDAGTPSDGQWGGITFLGPGSAPSTIDNLTVLYASNGLRCLSCQNLTARYVFVDFADGDAVLIRGGSNLAFVNITQHVNTYALQSVVGITSASGVSIAGVNGTGVADLLTLWNITNAAVTGPLVGSGVQIAGAWIDNATNVSVSGLTADGFPNGFRITRSSSLTISNSLITNPTVSALNATGVTDSRITGVSFSGGAAPMLSAFNVSGFQVDNATLSSTGFVLAINNSGPIRVFDSALSGGSVASSFLMNCAAASFYNVSASGGPVGFLFTNVSAPQLRRLNATGAAGDGIRVVGGGLGGGLLADSVASQNGGSGVALSNNAALRVNNTTVEGNGLRGLAVTASTLSLSNSTVRGNTLDGVLVASSGVVGGLANLIEQNGGEGLWVLSGNSPSFSATFRANALNGVRVDGGSLGLEDGLIENNTLAGILVGPAGACTWTARTVAVLTSEEVWGIRLVAGPGVFHVFNALVHVVNATVLGLGTLWLDHAFLNGSAGMMWSWGLSVCGGGTLAANVLSIDAPGNMSATSAALDWRQVVVNQTAAALVLTNTSAVMADVIFQNRIGIAPAIDLRAGSNLTAQVLLIAGGGRGIALRSSFLTVTDATMTSTSEAVNGTLSSVWFVNVSLTNSFGGVWLDQSGFLYARLTLGGTVRGITLLNSTAAGDALTVTGPGEHAVLLDASTATLTNSAIADAWSAFAVRVERQSSLMVQTLTLSGGGLGILADSSTVNADALDAYGDGPVRIFASAASLTVINSKLHDGAGEGIAATNGSSVQVTNTVVGPFSDEALRTTGGGSVYLLNVSMESQSATFGVDIDGAVSFSVYLSYLWAGAGGLSIRNSGDVVLDNLEIDAGGKALEILNASIAQMSIVNLDAAGSLGFEGADLGALYASQVTVNGTVGAVVLVRIATLSWDGAFLAATAGAALAVDTAPFASISRGSLSGTAASTLSASPDARLEAFNVSGSGLAVTSSSRLRVANSSLQSAGLTVTTTLDLVAYNVSFTLAAGQTAIALGANSSADLARITVSGGLIGVNGLGGPYLRVRNSQFTGVSNTSMLARSYTQLTIINTSSLGAANGFDVRYSPGALITNVTVTGSNPTGINIERSDNATLSGATLSPASGTGLRIAMSRGVRVERAAITGGTTALMLHNSTGALLANGTAAGSARGIVGGSGSSGSLTNMTFTGLTQFGAMAYNNSSLDLWRSSIASAASAPVFQAANATTSSLVRFFDSPADNARFAVASGGAIEVYWSLSVSTRSSGAPAPAMPVEIFDRDNVLQWSLATDGGGLAGPAFLLELRDTTAGRASSNPYTATSNGAGGLTGTTTFDLNAPMTVIIDLADTMGPSLEVRTAQEQRIAFGAVFTFGPNRFDGDNVGIDRYEWTFTDEQGAARTLTGNFASFFTAVYRFTKAGHYPVSVQAFDAANNPSAKLTDVIVWVNDPPFFLHPPSVLDLAAFQGVLFQLDLRASDNDTADLPHLQYNQSGLAGATFSSGFLFWTPSSSADASLTVTVYDGYDTVAAAFAILVGRYDPTNQPPFFVSPPVEAADIVPGHDYAYAVAVDDNTTNPRDTVVIQLVNGPPGMTLIQGDPTFRTALLSWRPSLYYQRTADLLFLNFSISIRAFDGKDFTYQNFTLALKNPPDEAPVIVFHDNITLIPGAEQRLDLTQFARDPDDDIRTLRWSILKPEDTLGATIGIDTEDPFELVIKAPAQLQGTQSFYITFVVNDTSGRSATQLVRVDLVGPTVVETAFPLLLLLVLVGGVGAAFAIATRQRAAALASEASSAPKGGGPSGGTAQALVPAAGAGFPFYLEGAALFESLDSLIAHVEVDGVDLESIWVLLPSVAREASLADGILRVVRLENHDVALVRDGDAMIAAAGLFAGDPSAWLEDPMREAAKEVQARALETNAVNLESLSLDAAVADALRALLALSGGSSREAVAKFLRDSGLRAGSVVELVEGLVRLKIAVDNNSGQLAADARLSVEYDDKVMRIERIEPALEQKRDKIQLGNLRPGERKTVAVYFDPQICTKSFFNATVSWEDASGGFHSTAMRTRPAEVVCPAFSTAQNANTAMLKRLLKEELSFRDSKYFRYPAQTQPAQVFEACKQAVLAQDVRLVKEIVTERPYRAEAWFFGETKVKHSPMVIWTAVFGEERVAQFSAASNAQASITGLLAELGRRLVHSRAGGGVGAPIEAVAKSSPEAEVGERPSLLSKSESAEADSE